VVVSAKVTVIEGKEEIPWSTLRNLSSRNDSIRGSREVRDVPACPDTLR
jgi:hypothetical protein